MSTHDFQADWITGNDDAPSSNISSKKGKTSVGTWANLGVFPPIVRALNLRGFKNPTPIQRAALPPAMANPPKDVLGMARTGSGKTLAYLLPLLHALGGTRRQSSGIRALILCPSRELAVQVLKVGKDLSRSLAGRNKDSEALRWSIIMGGESLDAQFESISANPDIVIATPGRFLHLAVEMDLDLRQVQVVVYDEADRLFEMGFEIQLREILHRLPSTRHNLLFSATLPTSLAEFAKAGLNNPAFIRLDTEHRISPDLELAFLSVKPDEKDAALLALLREAIHIPVASAASDEGPRAIIFASTKHHVEYISNLLKAASYRTSYIYGSLDQVARQQQLRHFRDGQSEVLVVTDVAARGLDIPAMGHVVNYDFPSGVRVFVHRVGRTARAGQKGHAWSLVTRDDLPYLHDLEVFLERSIISDTEAFGAVPQDIIEATSEYIHHSLETSEPQLTSLRSVMKRGQAMFERSRSKASREGYRALKTDKVTRSTTRTHPAFSSGEQDSEVGEKRATLLAAIHAYNPQETVFEVGARGGQHTTAVVMKQRRLALARSQARKRKAEEETDEAGEGQAENDRKVHNSMPNRSYRDPNFFLPHENVETNRSKGYSLSEGTSFAEQARSATMDLNADDADQQRAQKASQLKWDKKRKRFVKDTPGEDNKKMIRGESGALLPATFRSGRYTEWKKTAHRLSGQRAGSQSLKASGLASAETILKTRREKEKRQQKNGRTPKKRR
ncbi:DEAD-domain-containing protein [Cutaneotrichosporon oleaginosum]|uniref:RNA helicase n=1 Tax=Cutaneotrichosporon oleaginosum TaxID=879819 RepID=A0A0J0XG02_9TREE|nr:DEAD-domain-containing protein [Cutaneotrichosporon oleaginosum]KLT39998.1 DEAD-domain-containing protein [Cutaneotrichosporon oleaginosum]TXT14188.1 hypothetical protein COLE_00381 [Cutaneotrichosporon oleaginosum]